MLRKQLGLSNLAVISQECSRVSSLLSPSENAAMKPALEKLGGIRRL